MSASVPVCQIQGLVTLQGASGSAGPFATTTVAGWFTPSSFKCVADTPLDIIGSATQIAVFDIDVGFVVPGGATVHFDTCATPENTVLVLGAGCPASNADFGCLAANDDITPGANNVPGLPCPGGVEASPYASSLNVTTTGPTSHFFALVANYYASTPMADIYVTWAIPLPASSSASNTPPPSPASTPSATGSPSPSLSGGSTPSLTPSTSGSPSASPVGTPTASVTYRAPPYAPSGAQLNVPESALVGWHLCYAGLYSDSVPIASLQALCYKPFVMLGCKPLDSPTITLLGWATREDVWWEEYTSANAVHNANGLAWYYDGSYSWGFALAGDGEGWGVGERP